jgi:hypothetical protein
MPQERLENELEHMFREDLMVACQYWGIELSGTRSGTQLTGLLAKKMMEEETRQRVFATFTPNELDLLGMLSLNGGAMSYDRLKPYRKIYSYGQLNQTERDLRKKGIIIRRVMSRLTEHGREVAEFKIIDYFLPYLEEYFSEKPEGSAYEPKRATTIVNERDSLLVDILLLVSYLAKNEVSMTSSWEFPKREMENIIEPMSESTEERFDLVQKIARKAGAYAIVEEDRVVPGKVQALFSGKQDSASRRILLASLGRTRAIWATPDQPTEYTLNLIICRLRESSTEDWISIEEMRQWIRSELFIEKQPLKWIQVDEERVELALETPILLGLVEAAHGKKDIAAIRLTEVGRSVLKGEPLELEQGRETFIVQPNFELTVFTSEMDYARLYRLMLFTEQVKTDVVSTFKITESSIFQAIELGMREKDIVGFLEGESTKPVPNNVIRSIQDWTSQSTFATVDEVWLFETEDEEELEHLLLLDEFKKYVVRRVGPMAAVIQGNIEEFTEDLKEHKCHVKQAEKKPEESTQGPPEAGLAEQILLYGEEIEDVPKECEGCPALNSCNRVIRRKAESHKA